MQPVMQALPRLPHPPPEPLAPPRLPPRLPPLTPSPLKKIPPSPRKCPPWTKNSARSSKTRAATGPSTCTALTQTKRSPSTPTSPWSPPASSSSTSPAATSSASKRENWMTITTTSSSRCSQKATMEPPTP